MTELDSALANLREDMQDEKRQATFYDVFLNATFFVPTTEYEATEEEEAQVGPVVIDAEGGHYLMLFDSRERLNAWAESEVPCAEVPGHILAATTFEPLQWALNVGTEYSKRFLLEEIAWLREVVEKCEAEAAEAQAAQ